MPRTAILITLIVATFFGPLLCCCALGLTCTARMSPDRESGPAAAEGCPHCQKSEPSAPEPTKSDPDCPVCAKRAAAAIYVEVKPAPLPAAPVVVAWLPLDQLLPADPATSAAVEVVPLPDPRTFFLDSCHRLRC